VKTFSIPTGDQSRTVGSALLTRTTRGRESPVAGDVERSKFQHAIAIELARRVPQEFERRLIIHETQCAIDQNIHFGDLLVVRGGGGDGDGLRDHGTSQRLDPVHVRRRTVPLLRTQRQAE
jgi:hypothetical protein